MSDVTALRRRYEATPRTIDDDLHGLARGDRGCLGDGLAGVGALMTAIFGIIASMGAGGWGYMAIGAILFIAGFGLSAVHQSRSGVMRRRALEEGTLCVGRVLRADPALREPGIGCAPALVVLSTDPARRFDHGHLAAVGERLAALQPGEAGAAGELAALLAAPHIAGVPAVDPAIAGADGVRVAEVIVDKERLQGGAIREGEELVLIVDPRVGFVEQIG